VLGPDDEVGGAAEVALEALAELRDLAPIHAPHNEYVDVAVRSIGCGCEGSEYKCDGDLMKRREARCECLKWRRCEAQRCPHASSVRTVRVDGPEAEITEAPTAHETLPEQVRQGELRRMDVVVRPTRDLARMDLRPGQCREQAERVRGGWVPG